jgi:HEAT repeat protein
MNSSAFDELNKELFRAGVPSNYKTKNSDTQALSPIDALVNGPFSSKPYVDIILRYAPLLELSEKCFIVRALSEKGNTRAVPFLISLFQEYDHKCDFWAVGNALQHIDDKNSYNAILDICKNRNYGISRQMLMFTLAKMKTHEAYTVLIESLNDETIRAHAIEGLGRFGNIEAIPILKKLQVTKGKYEVKAKITALKRLNKKLNKL